MSLTFAQANDQILTVFKTAWDATTYQAFYESVRDQREDGTDPWAEVYLRHTAGRQATLSSASGSRMFRREGTLSVRIHTVQGNGLQTAYGLAKVVSDAFEGSSTTGGVWFRDVRINEVGRDGEFHITDVLIDFEYDEIK